MPLLTNRQDAALRDFLRTAETNGLWHLRAALPASHPLVRENAVRQIRRVKDRIAEGVDELGNVTVLTTDCRVLQLDAA